MFKCLKCGKCCSSIRGRIEEEERKFIEENFFGKLPITQLVPVEKMSLSLWPWEAKNLKDRAKQLGIKANIKPFRAVFDLNQNKSIILSYFLDYDNCPFLDENNNCKVYEDRPLVCKQFPIQTIGLDKEPVFLGCPALKDVNLRKDELKSFFGETYEAALKNDSMIESQNNKIMDLMKNNIIRPIKDYPYDFLLKRIENSEKIDFDEEIGKIIK